MLVRETDRCGIRLQFRCWCARARERERERSLSRARASFSDGDLFVKNEDLVLEDIWRRGDCESGAGGNTVRELNCDEEGRCW